MNAQVNPLLEVKGLGVSFGGVAAVNDVSFQIQPEAVTSLIGPNGAGKTTLFNLVTGAVRPRTGTVIFKGRDVTRLSPAETARLGISRTFQDLRLFLGMTVLENVMASFTGQRCEAPWYVMGRPLRVVKADRELAHKALAILETVGLQARAAEVAGELSYAEQKLVVIARAIAMGAALWLLDEPSSGLDRNSITGMLDLIRRLALQGQTIVIVEHNLSVVRDISDRILFLADGRLVADGTPSSIFADPDLQALYFGKRA
jgi:ABC-type branched-subunit amino acid transport system ATPase component